MKTDDKFWSELYKENRTRWDIGYPAPPLKEYFDQIKDKNLRILIPGAGNAYEAEYLYKNGFKNVIVLDWAIEPLNNLLNRYNDFPRENLICGDFFKHKDKYDLIVEYVFFCAIDPSLRQEYAVKVNKLLSPGGKMVGILFDDPLPDAEGPPFGGSKEEYIKYFEPYFNIRVYETAYNSIKPREGRELFCIFEKK
jgi:SAM-dependent methyltransferase